MTYIALVIFHLATVFPAFIIGTILIFKRKGTHSHKFFGKIYLLLMLITAVITLFIPTQVGPRYWNHFGFIHLLSLLTLITVPVAYFAARRGDIKTHRDNMIGLYVGGILIAGSFALFTPGRLLHDWLF